MRAIEIWASPEPTIARVNAGLYRDQRIETGHYERHDDIERLAALGIAATRYPVLWESVAPDDPRERDYAWEAARLERLRRAGVEPIVTLLHHGSGPKYTHLLDDGFAESFADYAEATARRFPWVRRWTPINEPLTTARFSTLYGVWYPNERDDRAFGKAIVNEMTAYLLAAARISRVVPDAAFLITEDLQSFHVADIGAHDYGAHKRERSFLSVDLACGFVDERHPLWEYLTVRCEVPAARLHALRRRARPPDLLGYNYYPNSERHLSTGADGRIENRPLVDVLGRLNPRPLLRNAWQRFRLPVAFSEVHVYGNESERVRWLLQRYDDVVALRAEGVDVRALGAWAAFGMIDWASLLCTEAGIREDGIYTCAPRGSEPHPTLLVHALRDLCTGASPSRVATTGWWERELTA